MTNFYNIWVNGVFIRRGDSSWVLSCDSTEFLLVRSVFWLSTGGFSSHGTGQVVSLGNRKCMTNFFNVWYNGVFIGWGYISWVVECDRTEVLFMRSVFWLSIGGF